jgi:hypothetical protein
MIIDLRKHNQKSSQDTHVFEADGRIYKLFRPHWRSAETIKKMFILESGAYAKAGSDSYLIQHIATFYGRVIIEDVLSAEGKSIAKDYFLDCCFALESLTGPEVKLTTPDLRKQHPHIADAQRRFEKISVDVLDSSVFNYADADRFKFIDFKLRS